MTTARIFEHGGSQAIRIPQAFRFQGSEVTIERHGDEVTLKAVPATRFESFAEIGAYLEWKHPAPSHFPEPPKARSLGATLVTANARQFKRVKGLKVREWKKPRT